MASTRPRSKYKLRNCLLVEHLFVTSSKKRAATLCSGIVNQATVPNGVHTLVGE